MEIDIKEFRERLNKEIANGNRNLGGFILREIRMAEMIKAHLMEEMKEDTKEFLNEAASKFDDYIFQIQEMEKDLKIRNLTLDQQTALNDEFIRGKIAREVDELHKLDPEKYPEDSNTDPDN